MKLHAKDITWREPWIRPSILLYKCGNQDWGYMKKVRDATNSWREIYLMELALYADTITQDYDI
ncbi:hypothetical protein Goarm_017062 [Gossypium armourianum]|uniref:Uncharacterized protein n=1 Tax=Gossypium armourianum TaxID=34283 RepID=A0A7J9JGR9_9ROSI|nr:hypothetical protein [Gossypium armourianum]